MYLPSGGWQLQRHLRRRRLALWQSHGGVRQRHRRSERRFGSPRDHVGHEVQMEVSINITRWCPSSELRSVGLCWYYFTRVDEWGLYRTSYWDYKPTFTSLGGHHFEDIIWWFPEIGVPPVIIQILVGFSINHPLWGTLIYGNLHRGLRI